MLTTKIIFRFTVLTRDMANMTTTTEEKTAVWRRDHILPKGPGQERELKNNIMCIQCHYCNDSTCSVLGKGGNNLYCQRQSSHQSQQGYSHTQARSIRIRRESYRWRMTHITNLVNHHIIMLIWALSVTCTLTLTFRLLYTYLSWRSSPDFGDPTGYQSNILSEPTLHQKMLRMLAV